WLQAVLPSALTSAVRNVLTTEPGSFPAPEPQPVNPTIATTTRPVAHAARRTATSRSLKPINPRLPRLPSQPSLRPQDSRVKYFCEWDIPALTGRLLTDTAE